MFYKPFIRSFACLNPNLFISRSEIEKYNIRHTHYNIAASLRR